MLSRSPCSSLMSYPSQCMELRGRSKPVAPSQALVTQRSVQTWSAHSKHTGARCRGVSLGTCRPLFRYRLVLGVACCHVVRLIVSLLHVQHVYRVTCDCGDRLHACCKRAGSAYQCPVMLSQAALRQLCACTTYGARLCCMLSLGASHT